MFVIAAIFGSHLSLAAAVPAKERIIAAIIGLLFMLPLLHYGMLVGYEVRNAFFAQLLGNALMFVSVVASEAIAKRSQSK